MISEIIEDHAENEESPKEEKENTDISKLPLPDSDEIDDDDDEDLDETLGERLWGLTEMFPDWLRDSTSTVTKSSVGGLSSLLTLSRSVMWIFFSSSCVLIAPVLFEVERGQIEEAQKQQQRQILLGPNSSMNGPGNPGMGMPMPPPPIAQR